MKKIYKSLLALFLFIGISQSLTSQVSTYTFTQSNGTYNAILGGTLIATATATTAAGTLDDFIYNLPAASFPFTFNFNGIGYTGCNISTNGFITFGTTIPSAFNTTPISNTALYAGAISAFGANLNSMFNAGAGMATGSIRYEVVGTMPNREIVIQYSNWRPSFSTSITQVYGMDFQIRLQETTNNISIVYGSYGDVVGVNNITSTRQIGLRGATNTDYNNRLNSSTTLFTSSTAGTGNFSTQTFSTTGVTPGMPTIGLTYSWTSPPLAPVTSATVSPTTSQCFATAHSVTATVTPGTMTLTSVYLGYSFNGVVQPTVSLTGGNLTSTSNWTGTIPAASPSNATVTWTVFTQDGYYNKPTLGTPYADDPLLGVFATPSASPNPLCFGSTGTLTAQFTNTTLPVYSIFPTISTPLTDEDFGNITFGTLNNTSTPNSLVGTIGVATGTAGGYSNFTSYGPFSYNIGSTYTLSLSSITAGGSYSNGFGLYIDYNKNGIFTDAGEAVYVSTVTISGPHTETATITIPGTSQPGLTRMRVIVNEGLVSGPNGGFSWGEYEEYSVFLQPNVTYNWSDGVSSIGSTRTLTVNPSITTTYSYTATNINGCVFSSNPVTLTVTPTPATPTTTNSTQCGLGLPTAMVAGGSSYKWYATPSSTLVLQAGSSTTFTTAINATTSYYVTSNVGLCESARALITASVTNSDPITATATPTAVCPGQSFTLTATSSGPNNNVYSYTWTPTPAAGSGISVSATGATVIVMPTVVGTYNYNLTGVDGVCTTTTSINVSLNAPPVINATATPTVICSGSNVMLNATTPVIAAGPVAVGTATTLTGATTQPTAFCNRWSSYRMQTVYTASELTALGLSAGNITSIAYNITTLGDAATNSAFTVLCGTTTASFFTNFIPTTGFVTTFPSATYTHSVGVNVINFSTPYFWDGVSNLVIEVSHGGANNINNALTYFTQTVGNTVATSYNGSATGTPSNQRLNIIITGQTQSSGASNLVWQWNPGSIPTNTASVNPVNTGTNAISTSYTITAVNPLTTCSNTAVVTVTVNPLPATPVAINSTQCGLAIPTASLSGGTSYNWYASPSSTLILQAGTSSNYTTAINSTTTWYVSSFSGICESPRVAVTETVTIPDAIMATSTSTAVCPGQSFTLTAASSGTNSNVYTYNWTATPTSGSGISGSVAGSTINVTPTIPGTYSYKLTGVDGICTATTSVNVTLNTPPSIFASASPTMICSASTVTLNALSAATGTVAIGTSTTNLTGATNQPTAFCNRFSSYRMQTIYTAAELSAAGLSAGNITSMAYSVSTLGDAASNNNFVVSCGPTSATTFTNFIPNGSFTTVFPSATYTHSVGLNVINFNTPYNWDGVSNLVFEVSHDGVNLTNNAQTYYTPTAGNSVATSINGGTTGTPSNQRLNVVFGSQAILTNPIDLTWQWNPGAINSNTTIVTPINSGSVAINTGYTITSTSSVTGCSNTASVNIVVNPIPVTPTVVNSVQCGLGIPTASVSGATLYNWYATPSSTTVLQAGTSSNYTTSINTTTTFYVSSFNGNCESPRVSVTTTVTAPPSLTLNAPLAICPVSGIATYSITSPGSNFSTYSWTPSSNLYTDAAATIPYTGGNTQMVYVKSNVIGISNVTVNATNTVTGCSNVATSSITINLGPTSVTVSSMPTPACAGQLLTLTANASGIPTTLISENFNGATNTWSTTNTSTGGTPANAAWTLRPTGYTSNVGTGITSNDASQFYLTDSDAQGSGSTANTTLQSPAINIAGLSSLNLSFFHFYNYLSATDIAAVEVSTNGSTWTTIQNYATGGTDIGTATGFVPATFNLNAYIGNPTLYVRFKFSAAWGYGWAIDNVSVTGSAAYDYSWTSSPAGFTSTVQSPTLTAMASAVYSATVTYPATGCALTGTTSVTVNPTPTVTAVASTPTSCATSSLTLTASGATTYSWMPAGGTSTVTTVNPSTSTIYTVTGTTLGCSATATVSINVTPTPIVNASASPSVICAGATTSLVATGNAATYTWSPMGVFTASTTATPTVSTTYSVTGLALGCTTTKTVNVTVNNVPTITLTPSSTICPTTSITLTAAGTSTAYAWSNGATTASTSVSPSVNTVYTFTGTNTCGTSTATTMVSLGTTPLVSASTSATLICAGNAAVLTASGTATSYSWSTGATSASISVTPTITTLYIAYGTNACGTTTATVIQNVSACVGINELVGGVDVSIYPNPATDYVTVTIPESIASNNTVVEITDALGKLVMKETLNTSNTTIRLTKLEDGVYFFKVISNNQMIKIGKVAKQ